MVDSDFCPWWEEYNDDDYGDLIRIRPYVDVALRPNAASRKIAEPSEFTDDEADSSGSDSESGPSSDESDSDGANDHDDADEDGVDIHNLAQAP